MLKTFEIGKIYGGYLAAQTGPGVGQLISIQSDPGNRFSDNGCKCGLLNAKYFFVTDSYPTLAGMASAPATQDERVAALGIEVIPNKKELGFSAKKKEDIIQFFRFVRPWDYDNNCPVSNMGATLAIEIDYLNRSIRVGIAITKTENFCKKTGRAIAVRRLLDGTDVLRFNIPEGGIPEKGVVWYIAEMLRTAYIRGTLSKALLEMVDGECDKCHAW